MNRISKKRYDTENQKHWWVPIVADTYLSLIILLVLWYLASYGHLDKSQTSILFAMVITSLLGNIRRR